MPHASRANLSELFCSYCGSLPMGPWRARAHRVCMRCERGAVLRAPAGAEPRHDAPFLILDRHPAVQAVSRHAVDVLSVDEPAGVGTQLDELLICENGHDEAGEVALRFELTIAGAEPTGRLELCTVANPDGRVIRCGAPPAAALVLAPRAAHAQPAPNGRPATNGNLVRAGGPVCEK
jgi:hypothetical protein